MRLSDPHSPAFGRHYAREVYGESIPEPRLTWAGLVIALCWLGLPMMLGLLAFDLAVWAIGLLAFDSCLAVWCVF